MSASSSIFSSFPITFQVRVVIVDENDCVPEFLQSIYSKDGVPETVTTATSLLQGGTTAIYNSASLSVIKLVSFVFRQQEMMNKKNIFCNVFSIHSFR